MRPTLQHQPALDGVRGVSVAAVLLFHAGVAGFSGGYLGVSVFFTLSGFLITTLLAAESDANGRVDAPAFYARRARRLLPASLLCVAALAVASRATDWFAAVPHLRRDLFGAVAQVANWVFLSGDESYADLLAATAGQASPVAHYWSLAIEEQFYWVWPLAFWLLWQVGRRNSPAERRHRLIAFSVLTTIACAASPIVAWVWGPDAAYWATPARVGEILLGALVAVVLHGRHEVGPAWSWAGIVALLVLAVAVITFPDGTGPAYHGALPLVAVASSVLIIGLQRPGPLRTALSWAPLAWLGRISYGVYLYHWPVYVVLDANRTGLDRWPLLAARLAVTLTIAQISFVVVERPIRSATSWRPSRVGVLALAATASVIVLGATVAIDGGGDFWRTDEAAAAADAAAIQPADDADLSPLVVAQPATSTTGPPGSGSSTTPAASAPDAGDSGPTGSDSPATTAPATTIPATTIPPLPALARPVRVVMAGDSTAEATGLGLATWASEQPALAQVSLEAERGCGFVSGGEILVEEWQPIEQRCADWLDHGLVDAVRDLTPDVVVLMTTSWDVLDHRWQPDEQLTPLDPAFRDHIEFDFTRVTNALLDAGAGRVAWIVEPVPNVFWWSSGQSQEDPRRHDVLAATMQSLAAAQPDRVSVIDLAGWADTEGLLDDHDVRPDGIHWSTDAAADIARRFLGEAVLRAALGLPQALP